MSIGDLTSEEIRFIETAIKNYPKHDEIIPLINSVLSKLRFTNRNATAQAAGYRGTVERISNREDLEIAVLTDEDTPVFRFIRCPISLDIRDVIPSGGYSYQHITLDRSNDMFSITVATGNYNRLSVSLNRYESEILLAFLLYYKMLSKGIDSSGLQPEANQNEEEARS